MMISPLFYCKRSLRIYRLLGFPLQATDESYLQFKYNKYVEVFKAITIQILAAFFNYSIFIAALFSADGLMGHLCSDGTKAMGWSVIDGLLFNSLCWVISPRNIALVMMTGSRAWRISDLNSMLANISERLSSFMSEKQKIDLAVKRSLLPFNNAWKMAAMWVGNAGSVSFACYGYYSLFVLGTGLLNQPFWMKYVWLLLFNTFTINICVCSSFSLINSNHF